MQLTNRLSTSHMTNDRQSNTLSIVRAVYLIILWISALSLGFFLSFLFAQNAQAHALAIAPSNVIYVNNSATGPIHDGLSWTTAYTNVQDALLAAVAGDEIWVAAGIYYPDEGTGTTPDTQNATFMLKSGVVLYGGFIGSEETRNDRNWLSNLTILSGDLTQNDPVQDNMGIVTAPETIVGPNAYHVVTAKQLMIARSLMGL